MNIISSYVRKSLLHFSIYHENVQAFWDSAVLSCFAEFSAGWQHC
jgi:hypothetical protein